MDTTPKFASPGEKSATKVFIPVYGEEIDLSNTRDLAKLVKDINDLQDPELDAAVEKALSDYPRALEYLRDNSSYWRSRSSGKGVMLTDGLTLELIKALQKAVDEHSRKLPSGYEEVWRFHSTPLEYQSHQYREALKSGTVVSDAELEHWAKDPILVALHMFKSSYKSNSVCVSYARSLDSLLKEASRVGADSSLAQTIRGGEKEKPAALLAYTQIPSAQLVKPEQTDVPKYTYVEKDGGIEQVSLKLQAIERLSEARDRAIRETEALHLPLPTSGGRTYPPLAVFENPFPQVGKTSKLTLKQMPQSFLTQYK